MRRLRDVAFVMVVFYALTLGATFNGLLTENIRLLSAGLMTLFGLVWGVGRLRAPHPWRPTALDLPIVLWLLAFLVSLVANLDQWRRIVEGLWYMGLYVALWYTLHDWIVGRRITRRLLVDALLAASILIAYAGLAQVWVWIQGGGLSNGLVLATLLRPVSTLGNPNTLGAFLVLLLPLTLDRVLNARQRLARMLYAVLFAVSLLLLAMSFSRGGWIGSVAAFAVYGALTLNLRDLARLWATRRAWVIGVGIVLVAGISAIALVGFNSLNTAGRTFDLRAFIWNTALESFSSKPVTGYGLFTFGGQLALRNSTPFTEPHSHAHNLPLHVVAELGIVGLVALVVTLIFAVRAFMRNRRAVTGSERRAINAAGAAAAGFGAHHLLDLPAMSLAIGLTMLILLLVALAPPVSQEAALTTPARTPLVARLRRLSPALLATLWAGLIVTGIGGALVYYRYMDILGQASTGDFRSGAEAMGTIIALDPAMPVYSQQEGMLWALTARYQTEGDSAAIASASVAFERYTALAPQYSFGWANLGALYAASEQWADASSVMCHAADLAPKVPIYWWRCGEYSEASGSDDAALAAYTRALALQPDLVLYPRWQGSPLREQAAALPAPLLPNTTVYERVVQAVRMGMTPLEAARTLPADLEPIDMREHFLADWPALADGGESAWAGIQVPQEMRDARAWQVLYGRYLPLAETAQVGDPLAETPYADEFHLWENIGYIQFLRLTIPRQYVPQADYPVIDGLLASILAADAAGTGDLPPAS